MKYLPFKSRAGKIALQLLIVVMIFSGLRWYQQRDLIIGLAPEISGQLLNGELRSLADLRGEPVLLYFWGTWCGICRLQAQDIEAISKDHAVLSIAMQSGSAEQVIQYMNSESTHFPVILDNGMAEIYGVKAVPTFFVIDPMGSIQFTERGYTTAIGLRLRLWLSRNL
jgi:thiol-disulfide isomerase/thioredoxin